MVRIFIAGIILSVIIAFLIIGGCEKEKIVESTEYVHDIVYVELPPDTVIKIDTVFIGDSVTIYATDTIFLFDTVVQVEYVYDTVTIVQHHYDTTVVTDTVLMSQCDPNEYLAIAALHYYSDPLVLEYIDQQFGYNDGWIFYLSSFQLDMTRQSSDIYDIYGYIDYWTPDWSGFYPLEFYWRLTYTDGDPADPRNWQISEPPAPAPGHQAGIKLIDSPSPKQPSVSR
ncbi:MAG: hypothetical protein JSU69_00405 [Candidatus Zixiibacteriota bacterium]|nr:MAG: hypothetical protein JSU69_00405 [candidate division Zixibacteria bacterium]